MQPKIGIDVGGSTVKSGVVQEPGKLTGSVKLTPVESEAPAEVILDLFASVISEHAVSGTPLEVGFGFPGPFDYHKGVCKVEGVAKYSHLYDLDIGAALRERLGPLRLNFRNDAEAAIVGESLYGAAKNYRKVLGLSLGSGCGSAFLVDGVPQASGPGVPENGWVYPLPYADGRADDIFSIRGLRKRLAHVNFEGTIPEAAAKACQGDLELLEVWMAFGQDLGWFVEPLARDFGAEAVLIVGGIAGAGDLFTPHMQVEAPIHLGSLGRAAAILGAAEPLFEAES